MTENSATKEQLVELEQKVDRGFADLKNELKILTLTIKEQNDARYTKQEDQMNEALLRLDNPAFRQKALTLGNDWAKTDEGKQHIKDAVCQYLANSRDSAIKWIQFAKLVLGAVLTGGAVWFGITIMNNQHSITKLIETIK
jgi:hypothetical protein